MTSDYPKNDPSKPIKIGMLFSRTGVVSIVEVQSYITSMMVVDQINKTGGVNGAMLEPVVRDPGSVWANYAKFAKELMAENVNIFWGCYTSASREALIPVTERGGALLCYGTRYKGRECSPLYLATGAQPNQQIYDAVPWMVKKAGLTKDNTPILSRVLIENQIDQVGLEYCEGHYTSLLYFKSLQNEENDDFIKKYTEFTNTRPEFKADTIVTQGVMEGAYNVTRVCVEAMMAPNSVHPAAIVEAARGMELNTPEDKIGLS